jgi:alpha-beta hydrolase superfamily lysophospholipase
MSIYPTNPRTWAQLDALDPSARRALLDAHAPLGGPASSLGPHGGRLRYLSAPGRDAELAAYFYPARDPAAPGAAPYRGVVVAVHGHGAYWQFEFLRMARAGGAHVYDGSWVDALNARGYSVCGVDNTGSGRSSGRFGLVERAEDLRDDVLALLRALRGLGGGGGGGGAGGGGEAAAAAPSGKRRSGGGGAPAAPAAANPPVAAFGPALAGLPGFDASLPLFLLGPSLGGGIVVQAALAAEARLAASAAPSAAAPTPFAGLVLLAPLLGLEGAASRGWNPYLRRAAALLDALPPTREWPVAAQDPNVMFPEQQLDFDCDPVTYHYPCRVRTAVQLLRACSGVLPLSEEGGGGGGGAAAAAAAAEQQRAGQPLREAARRLRAPVLAFHSARDTLCDCSATEGFVQAAREGQVARAAAAAAAEGGGGKKGAAAAAAAAEQRAVLRRCDHLWHSILREDARGELLREAIAWMDARVAAAAAGGAKQQQQRRPAGAPSKPPPQQPATAAARITVAAASGKAAAAGGKAASSPASTPRSSGRARRSAAAH